MKTRPENNKPTYGPFAETTPTGQSGWIDETREPAIERVKTMLNSLDASTRFTYSIWRGDDPYSIVATHRQYNDAFIQAAGSAQAMTVEIRISGEDENMHLYVVGRAGQDSQKRRAIPMSTEHEVQVFEHEVFTAEEAVSIFWEFYGNETAPASYELRELKV